MLVIRTHTQTLLPFVDDLRTANHTRLTLQLHLRPLERVGYRLLARLFDDGVSLDRATATGKERGGWWPLLRGKRSDHLSRAIDEALQPVMNCWMTQLRLWQQTGRLDEADRGPLELDFCILD